MDWNFVCQLISILLIETSWAASQNRTMSECHTAGVNCSRWAVCYFENTTKDYTCRCLYGYKGDLCEEDVNECERGSAPCLKRGVCHNFIGSFRCDCLPGWEGTHCHQTDGLGLATCITGYTGVNCTDDFDECKGWRENPCEHNSTCINTVGNFSCSCVTGWEGRICNQDIDECRITTGLCHNGGNCTNIPGSYKCVCPYPYTGAACDYVSSTASTTTEIPSTSTPSSMVGTTTQHPDGGANWGVWTAWSGCDVTCGVGSRSRTRTLDPPSTGVTSCVSREREILVCDLAKCPVLGLWSTWSDWGHCSVSCGIGLERRNRNCSSLYDGSAGVPCSGDSTEDRPCFIRACADGIWSDWSAWGTCSATCLGGIQRRSRDCNNPAPSQFGHDCVGNSQEVKQCSNQECQAQSSSQTIAFRAQTLSNLSPSHGETLVYTNTELNQGGGYDSNRGVFTAPMGGVYLFVVQTCAAARHDFRLSIVKDGHIETSAELYYADDHTCSTTNALVPLVTGNSVWVASQTYSSGNVLFEDANHVDMFQGTRIGI